MSLKQELETWAAALDAFDKQDYPLAIATFSGIAESSKVLFSMGVIAATTGAHEDAVGYFRDAVGFDSFLAVGYFQMGVSMFLLEDYEGALAEFENAFLYLRGNQNIDYTQLGLAFKLYSAEVLFNTGLCKIYLGDQEGGMADFAEARGAKATPEHEVIEDATRAGGEGYTVFSIPVGVCFRPSESKLRNLKTKDYMGKAKLVAAAEADDAFTGFTGITRRDRGQNPSGAPLQGADLKRALTLAIPSVPEVGATVSRTNTVAASKPQTMSVVEPMARSNTIGAPVYNASAAVSRGPSMARGPSLRVQPVAPARGPQTAAPSPVRRPSLSIPQNQDRAGPISAGPRGYDSPPSLIADNMTDSNRSSPANGPTTYSPPRMVEPKAAVGGPRGKSMRATELYDDYYNNPGKYDEDVPDLPVIIERYAQPDSPPDRHAISSWNNKVDRNPGRKMSLSRKPSSTALGSWVQGPEVMGRRPSYAGSRTSRRSAYQDDSGSEDYDRDMEKVRVKIHCGKDVRGMAIVPGTTLDDFVIRLAKKFGKQANSVDIKFKDEEGDLVSLKDEDDFESAVDCARAASKGRSEGKLEVWIEV